MVEGWQQMQTADVLPTQFFHFPSARSEDRLSLAIVEQAIFEFHANRHAASGKPRTQFLKAQRYLFIDEWEWLFSFVRICDRLRINAGAVRTVLQNEHWTPGHRARSNVMQATRKLVVKSPQQRKRRR